VAHQLILPQLRHGSHRATASGQPLQPESHVAYGIKRGEAAAARWQEQLRQRQVAARALSDTELDARLYTIWEAYTDKTLFAMSGEVVMTISGFLRLCVDCCLMDGAITPCTVDWLARRHRPSALLAMPAASTSDDLVGNKKLNFSEFREALLRVAAYRAAVQHALTQPWSHQHPPPDVLCMQFMEPFLHLGLPPLDEEGCAQMVVELAVRTLSASATAMHPTGGAYVVHVTTASGQLESPRQPPLLARANVGNSSFGSVHSASASFSVCDPESRPVQAAVPAGVPQGPPTVLATAAQQTQWRSMVRERILPLAAPSKEHANSRSPAAWVLEPHSLVGPLVHVQACICTLHVIQGP
jgi:hypothetical protein